MSKFYTNSEIATAVAGKANVDSLGTMAYIDDAPSDGNEYLRKNGAWSKPSSADTAIWGNISGTLSNQTDLKNALDAKQDTLTDSGWVTVPPRKTSGVDNYSGTIQCRKIGNLVEVRSDTITLTNQLTADNYIYLATIPSGYRPSTTFHGTLVTKYLTKPTMIGIATNGIIIVYAPETENIPTTYNLYIAATYFIG